MSEKAVYKAIASVMADLSKDGISKERNNKQQHYKFRGIDDVYNALSSRLSNAGLCVLPRILKRECVERRTAKGGVLFYVIVEAEFDFVASDDGSAHTVRTFGEAMDTADKATNKAMSAAYKYACMQAFCIPTEGDNDADAATHEIDPQSSSQQVVSDDLRNMAQGMADKLKAIKKNGTLGDYETLTDAKEYKESLHKLHDNWKPGFDRIGELMTEARNAVVGRGDGFPAAAE